MEDKILAKSVRNPGKPEHAETLMGHTQMVVRSFQILFGPGTSTQFSKDWIRFFRLEKSALKAFYLHGLAACGLHDTGKANNGFQEMVSRKKGIQVIRHEHLSGLFLYLPAVGSWLKQFPGLDARILFAAVAGHHLRTSFENFAQPLDADLKIFRVYPNAIMEILNFTGKMIDPSVAEIELEIPDVWDFDGSMTFDPVRLRDDIKKKELMKFTRELKKNPSLNGMVMAVRAGLILADSAGSAVAREGKNLDSWLKDAFGAKLSCEDIQLKVIAPRIEQIRAKKGYFDWNGFQDAAENLPRRSLLLAPCGSGKTLAAWRWVKAQLNRKPAARVLFLYPTRATATEGFRDYVSWAPESDAALIHGTSDYELENMFSQPEDVRFGRDYTTEDRMFALGYWYRKIFSATVDQFLGFMQQSYRSICLLPLLSESVVVFDEVHSFDRSLFSALKRFLNNFDVPALCMTASLPPARRKDLLQDCGLTLFPSESGQFDDLEGLAGMPRYTLHRIEGQEEAESIAVSACGMGKRVLWVVNTVSRCQMLAKKLGAVCYHSRFKLEDRKQMHDTVIQAFQKERNPILAVTTQVCEMSLDLDADVLISEVAPITSMIQRMGRCNRHARLEEKRMGQVYVYTPEDEAPYTMGDLVGVRAFLQEIEGGVISQRKLEALLEKHGPSDVEVEKYSAFLESGTWAMSREYSLREESHFTVNAILDNDLSTYFDLRTHKKPIDRLLVPVPRRFAYNHPKLQRFPMLAPSTYYSPEFGFLEYPLEEIL
ncbi:CRISPR-associated helicase/endonuclease Cas3 [Desulfococcus multivorans]|uniref:CRISPR-associated helicase Cas3 n=1 Tax=Desulfococcus multivorans DSM 2059 TaxID=1121405 RepID=S7V5N6_DESML|nr:CRISPR-associated helicase/endonuclease Cas3 [Desulfococcus multivorans]AOY57177.1 Cas3: CRISPR-associated helicase, Cas3 [Desulfococcus multivorans]AQU99664.1 CRISPR-associated helicase/endonuclease Cas3 [Desulfococcus multivorans]EPR39928.1 CRISPR-associated helicase Cas3 [Desulfococcus multivorans DSM 2059]SKA23193.1 CRISPR-associated endonuclease/helicase Cas3 [Desulfococcus multivorans DSM 2059]